MLSVEEMNSDILELKDLGGINTFQEHITAFAQKLECHKFAYFVVPEYYQQSLSASIPSHLTNFGDAWSEHYSERRFDMHDLNIKQLLADDSQMLIWNRSFDLKQLPQRQQKVFIDARQFDIQQGIMIPAPNVSGSRSAVTFVFDTKNCEIDRFIQTKIGLMQTYAYAFNDAILARYAYDLGEPHKPKLTRKEMEVLKWLSTGLRYDQVADKLNIGVSTIRKHVQSVLRKLRAKNSSHAVALGIRWGLIR